MQMPKIVSPQEWQAARDAMLVEEKALTRARDALAAAAQADRHPGAHERKAGAGGGERRLGLLERQPADVRHHWRDSWASEPVANAALPRTTCSCQAASDVTVCSYSSCRFHHV